MAGDWIKFEVSTPDKPEVWQMAEKLDLDPDAVVGKLLRVWCWFDTQTENGNAPSVTKRLLDRDVGVNGFCDCMISVGWMIEKDGVFIPNFDRHNGQSAKKRALGAKRQAAHRKGSAESSRNSNAIVTQEALPEKRRDREDLKEDTSVSQAKPDHSESIKKWNDFALQFGLTQINGVTPKRQASIKSAYKLYCKTSKYLKREPKDEQGFISALVDVAIATHTEFHLGKNDRNWRMNFDYLLQNKIVDRVTEHGSLEL